MNTLEQATQLQQDFAYIIAGEQQNGMETSSGCITLFFKHGGVIKEFRSTTTATMPTDNKYLELKAKYFPNTNSLSIFYPNKYKKYLDNIKEV
jgi:hypothetical protein